MFTITANVSDLKHLTVYNCHPDEEQILEWFKVLGAGWIHNGDPARPHALLHSGKHSNGFFLCKKVLKYGNLREILATRIAHRLECELARIDMTVDGVFGAPYSSITLAADVARILGVPNYIVEKQYFADTGDQMMFKADDPIPEGANLLQVEELITTFDSARSTTKAIAHANPNAVKFAPFVGVVIHRPPATVDEYDNRKVVALVNKVVSAWTPEQCPLCKAGSIALAPKTHWVELTA